MWTIKDVSYDYQVMSIYSSKEECVEAIKKYAISMEITSEEYGNLYINAVVPEGIGTYETRYLVTEFKNQI